MIKDIKNDVLALTKNKSQLNRINQFLSRKYMIILIVILFDFIGLSLVNLIINMFLDLIKSGVTGFQFKLGFIFLDLQLLLTSKTVRLIYLMVVLIMVVLDAMLIYQIKTSLSQEHFNVDQKGNSRFVTVEEIKQQYKEIPEKEEEFPGAGGTIISRFRDKLYIDTSPTNNLIIGMTRSGKGEFFVIPSIDVYSRAEEKASMIILDPKSELYRSSKKTLEERGYDTYFFNLIDPLHSMGYNPLTLIIDYYKKKLFDEAELLADSFAYSVYSPNSDENSGNDKFFDETSSGVFSALILSHVNDCLYEDERLNTKRLEAYTRKVELYKNLVSREGIQKEKLKRDYYILKADCKKNQEDEFLSPKISYIPEEEEFYYVDKYEKCINVYSILNMVVELSQQSLGNSDDMALDEFFRVRPPLDPGKMRYATAMVSGAKTKGSILANLLTGLNVFQSRAIAKMTAESTMDFKQVGFGERPVAVFMGIPDYNRSKHFLAVAFIRQVYYYLAETCSKTVGRCKRHVKFICDEFGSMPEIDDMESMITVCLGRNISFDLYIQDYSMLNRVYGEAADTIVSNCGNKIYILANSYDVAESISKDLGTETRVNLQRSGKKLSLDKSFTEMIDDEALLDPNKLMRLRKGECVVIRSMKRTDLNGNDIFPYPIFNSIDTGTRFLYRYEYLQDTFPDPDDINLKDINSESRKAIDPTQRIWDFHMSFARFKITENTKKEVVNFQDLQPDIRNQVLELLEKNMGTDMATYGINEDSDISLAKLISVINQYPFMDAFDKQSLNGTLKSRLAGESNVGIMYDSRNS